MIVDLIFLLITKLFWLSVMIASSAVVVSVVIGTLIGLWEVWRMK